MQTLIGLAYYLVAGLCFALMGAAGHVIRAKFNLVPDLLFRGKSLNLIISDGYDIKDMLLGTEYDDAGYYRFDSIKNFRISVGWTLGTGWCLMLLSTGLAVQIASLIDVAGLWFWDLVLLRIREARLW